ncbi:MAG: hypothetical protein IJM25_03115 [Eubacterium sp.]|nr:hypothetical protein [Eubacterium sp.]
MKKDRKHLAAIALALALAVSGCGSGAGEESTGASGSDGSGTESSTGSVLTPDKPQLAEGIVNLSEQVSRVDIPTTEMSPDHGTALSGSGIRMLDQLIKTTGDPKANYLISPTSLQMALGMTVTGADAGTATEKELMAVLMPGTDGRPDTLNEEMATFANRMLHSDGVSWNVANSIWVRNNINVALRDSYVSDVTNSYAAELFSAPFDQSTLDSINSWVNTNTKERIPKILDKLDQNAAHFRAMLTEESAEVKIGTVIHKTMIKVDRKGTVAAASTTVEMRTKGAVMTEPPYQVILDRPFVYGIVDAATGVPVFLGVQNKMN